MLGGEGRPGGVHAQGEGIIAENNLYSPQKSSNNVVAQKAASGT